MIQSNIPTDFKEALASLTKYLLETGMNIKPLPKIKIIGNDQTNANKILGSTAHYIPGKCEIVLYTMGRHPKDVLRSFSHEMIHREQDNEGRLNQITTTNVNEDDYLKQLEEEAYLKGNMNFRKWENSFKK
jgi:hypothetical protein